MNAFIQFVKENKVVLSVGTVLLGTAVVIYVNRERAEVEMNLLTDSLEDAVVE